MENKNTIILLNEILKIEDLKNVKVRFNLMFSGNWNPADLFRDGDTERLLKGQYWNYKKNKSFKDGQVTIGLLKLNASDTWLLFHVGWSKSLIASPILGFFILAFIAGDDADAWLFATETTVGNVILGVTSLVMVWSTIRTYLLSIQDNGLILGLFIGTAKVLIAVVIALFAIGLISYLFRDQRKLGHIAIFFMLFAVFGWFVNVLVNGERTGVA